LTVAEGAGCVSTNSSAVTITVRSPPPATPVISAPLVVGAGSPNRKASVESHPGSFYTWTITNGTITSGQGTSKVLFTAGSEGTLTLAVVETVALNCSSLQATTSVEVTPPGTALLFYTLPPCRLVDTRLPSSFPGGPSPLGPAETRTIGIGCGIPTTAKALTVNVTVVGPTADGSLSLWGAGQPQPSALAISFRAGLTRANNVVIGMPGDALAGFRVTNESQGFTPLVIDVSGFFE
jgi:hypothetical protein